MPTAIKFPLVLSAPPLIDQGAFNVLRFTGNFNRTDRRYLSAYRDANYNYTVKQDTDIAQWSWVRIANAAKRVGKWAFEFTINEVIAALSDDNVYIRLDQGSTANNGGPTGGFFVGFRLGEVRHVLPSSGSVTTNKPTFTLAQRGAIVVDLDSSPKTVRLYSGLTLMHTWNLTDTDMRLMGTLSPFFGCYTLANAVTIHADLTLGVHGDALLWTDLPNVNNESSLFDFNSNTLIGDGSTNRDKHSALILNGNCAYANTSLGGAWVMSRVKTAGKRTGKHAFEFTPRTMSGYNATHFVVGIVNKTGNFTSSIVPHQSNIPSCYVSGANAFVHMPNKTATIVNPAIAVDTRCAFVMDLDSPTKTIKFYVGNTLVFTQELIADDWYPLFGFFTASTLIEVHTDLTLGVHGDALLWNTTYPDNLNIYSFDDIPVGRNRNKDLQVTSNVISSPINDNNWRFIRAIDAFRHEGVFAFDFTFQSSVAGTFAIGFDSGQYSIQSYKNINVDNYGMLFTPGDATPVKTNLHASTSLTVDTTLVLVANTRYCMVFMFDIRLMVLMSETQVLTQQALSVVPNIAVPLIGIKGNGSTVTIHSSLNLTRTIPPLTRKISKPVTQLFNLSEVPVGSSKDSDILSSGPNVGMQENAGLWANIRPPGAAKYSGIWAIEFTPTFYDWLNVSGLQAGSIGIGIDNGKLDYSTKYNHSVDAVAVGQYAYILRDNTTIAITNGVRSTTAAQVQDTVRHCLVLDLDSPTKTLTLYRNNALVYTQNLVNNMYWFPVLSIASANGYLEIHNELILGVSGLAQLWSDFPTQRMFDLTKIPIGQDRKSTTTISAEPYYQEIKNSAASWATIRACNSAYRTGIYAFEFTPFLNGGSSSNLMVGFDSGLQNYNSVDHLSASEGFWLRCGGSPVNTNYFTGVADAIGVSTHLQDAVRHLFIIDMDLRTITLYRNNTLAFTQTIPLDVVAVSPLFSIFGTVPRVVIHNTFELGLHGNALPLQDFNYLNLMASLNSTALGTARNSNLSALSNIAYNHVDSQWASSRISNSGKTSGKWALEFTLVLNPGFPVEHDFSQIGIDNGNKDFSVANTTPDSGDITNSRYVIVKSNSYTARTLPEVDDISAVPTKPGLNVRCALVLDLNSVVNTLKLYIGNVLTWTQTLPDGYTWYPYVSVSKAGHGVQIHKDLVLNIPAGHTLWNTVPAFNDVHAYALLPQNQVLLNTNNVLTISDIPEIELLEPAFLLPNVSEQLNLLSNNPFTIPDIPEIELLEPAFLINYIASLGA